MQEGLRRFSAKAVAADATTMQCRIGINTDEVVVGSIQTGAGPEGPAAQAAETDLFPARDFLAQG
jgi:class 3 adenylate cyclase